MSSIHLLARAVIQLEDKLLVCRVKGAKWCFLPGGHVEHGEPIEIALLRELKEEAGLTNLTVKGFVGAVENAFPLEDGSIQHELNLVFEVVGLPEGATVRSMEDHLEYAWVQIADLPETKLLPATLKQSLLIWLENEKTFWQPCAI